MASDRHVALVLGGARSGKSGFAVRLAGQLGEPVVFVATCVPGDAEMQAKVAAHRAERSASWRTIEEPLTIAAALRGDAAPARTVLVDCLSMLAANHWLADRAADLSHDDDSAGVDPALESALTAELASLVDVTAACSQHLVVVSSEVGLGVVPAYPSGRAYRELLGGLNQYMAAQAHTVYLMIAGIPVDLRALSAQSVLWQLQNLE